MSWFKRGNKDSGADNKTNPEENKDTWGLFRPVEPDFLSRGVNDIARMPTIPFVGFRFCYDLYQYSDLLRTIMRSLIHETFRNGIIEQKNFVKKCSDCDAEYNTDIISCDVCGSTNLREPDRAQYEFMREWKKKVNFNDQSLEDVCKDGDLDVNIIDNVFFSILKRYDFKDGKVVGAHPIEFLRAHPERCNFVFDNNGIYGRTDDGRVVLFCLEHRDKYVLKKNHEVESAKCAICGKKLYVAYWRSTKMGSKYIYYTKGEMKHFKKFSYGLGYGLPPMFSVWQKVQILMKMDFFMLSAYSLERPPKGLLLMKGNRESIDKAWRRLQEEARTNPHMIYPLVVEGSKDIKNVMEWLDLTLKSDDINFIEFRDELRRTIGALWGVMPIFHGDTSAGMGLSNEGLQILVTNRAVESEQALFNKQVFPWLCKELGITDWTFKCVPNEGRDVVSRLQREQLRIQNAQQLVSMGYIAQAIKTEDGIDFEIKDPLTQEAVPSSQTTIVKKPLNRDNMQRFSGEPEHNRASADGQFGGEGGVSGVRNSKSMQASGSNAGAAMAAQEKSLTVELEKDDVTWFTDILDDADLDVLKSGWGQAINNRFNGIANERFSALEMADFWHRYSGISAGRSAKINGIIMKAVMERNTNRDEIVDEILKITGNRIQAEMIAETEMSNIALEARKIAYERRTDASKFGFVASNCSCDLCKAVASRTKDGVSLGELEAIVKFENPAGSRGLMVHPKCKCSFKSIGIQEKI